MKKLLFNILASLLVLFFVTNALSQSAAYTPKQGSPERTAIMDALRKPVEEKLKQKVIFEVSHLKVQDGWAFLYGTPQQPGGKPIDYSKTPFKEEFKEGVFDNNFSALLHKKDDQWQVVALNIGATDVVWEDWDKQYKAPSAIFKD